MAEVVVNRTNTNIEACFICCTGWIASSTEVIKDALSAPGIAKCASTALYQFVWGVPAFAIQLAPKTFAVAYFTGACGGFFSLDTTNKILDNVDAILSGGAQNKHNVNVKVSLIFALIILNQILPIPFPSISKFYAAAAGVFCGLKAPEYIPGSIARLIAERIDSWLPFEKYSAPEKKPPQD